MSNWDGKSKGTAFGYKIFIFAINIFGISSAYFILKIVAFYYYLFAQKNRQAILDFYTGALHIPLKQAKSLCRKNFFIFGQTLIDRFAFLLGKEAKFTQTFHNEKYLIEMNQGGKGGILLSAHLGNWETAGNLLKQRITSKINVVMLEAEEEKIQQLIQNTTGGSKFNIIAIKDDLSHIIKINNALNDNEFIAIHADRHMEGMRFLEMDFLGKKARFPLGPFIIASKFNAPVTFVFALKEGLFHYNLSATIPVQERLKPEEFARLYIEELEKRVKLNPEQWFNYFNFYQS